MDRQGQPLWKYLLTMIQTHRTGLFVILERDTYLLSISPRYIDIGDIGDKLRSGLPTSIKSQNGEKYQVLHSAVLEGQSGKYPRFSLYFSHIG